VPDPDAALGYPDMESEPPDHEPGAQHRLGDGEGAPRPEMADEGARQERAYHCRKCPYEVQEPHHDTESTPARLAPEAPRG